MSFITHAQNKDASAFKELVEETLASKVVMVLEALKIEVASQFFNEEGGVSGGVASVKKKPTPPAAGTVVLPGPGADVKSYKRQNGIRKAVDKLAKEEVIDESAPKMHTCQNGKTC